MHLVLAKQFELSRHATLATLDYAFGNSSFATTILPSVVNDIGEACSRHAFAIFTVAACASGIFFLTDCSQRGIMRFAAE